MASSLDNFIVTTKQKISEALLVLAGALIIMIIILVKISNNRVEKNSGMIDHTYHVLHETQVLLSSLKDAETGQRGYLLTNDKTYLEPYTSGISDIQQSLTNLKTLTTDNAIQQKRLVKIGGLVEQKLVEMNESIQVFEAQGDSASKAYMMKGYGKSMMDELRAELVPFEKTEHELLGQRNQTLLDSNQLFQWVQWILCGLSLIIIGTAVRAADRQKAGRKKLFEELNQNNHTYVLNDGKNPETEEEIVQSLINNLVHSTEFVLEVGKGEYNTQLKGMEGNEAINKNNLGSALLDMRNKMQQTFEEERQRTWSNAGLAQIGDILRASTSSLSELYDNIIRFVVKYTNSNQGGLFIFNEEESEHYLELVASYAFERKKFLDKKIEVGEGLVGQCFLEGEKILMTKIPSEYISITSGLGYANPNVLLILPLKVNGKVFGVLEIASFTVYQEYEVNFIESLAESIASTISSVVVNENTRILLERTQQQAEEMRAQEEEMRQNMEELSATQEELERRQGETTSILQKFDLVAQTTTEGLWDMVMPEDKNIVDDTPFFWTDRFRHMLGYKNEQDFPNVLHAWSDLLHPDHKQNTLNAFSAHLLDKSGKTPYDVEYQIKLKDGSWHWFRAVGNSLRDDKGNALRIAGSLIDIQPLKDMKILQDNLEKKIVERTSEIEELLTSAQKKNDQLVAMQQESSSLLERFTLASQTTTEGLWDMVMPADKVLNDETPRTWTDRFRQMLGYKNEQDFPNVQGSWSRLLHPDHKPRIAAAFKAHLFDTTGKTPYDVEYQLNVKDGSWRWFRAIGNTLRDKDGNAIRVAGSLIDIQAKKDTEALQANLEEKIKERTSEIEELLASAQKKNDQLSTIQKESENLLQRFNLASQTTTEGLWDMVMPADGNIDDETPFFWTDRFRHMLGYKNEKDFPNVLHSWSDLLHPDHKQATLNAFSEHLLDKSGKTPYNVEYQLKLKSGSWRWFRAVGNTLRDENGNAVRIAGSLIDIQVLKEYEGELKNKNPKK